MKDTNRVRRRYGVGHMVHIVISIHVVLSRRYRRVRGGLDQSRRRRWANFQITLRTRSVRKPVLGTRRHGEQKVVRQRLRPLFRSAILCVGHFVDV